jgi:hypothetical protein
MCKAHVERVRCKGAGDQTQALFIASPNLSFFLVAPGNLAEKGTPTSFSERLEMSNVFDTWSSQSRTKNMQVGEKLGGWQDRALSLGA